MEKIRILILVCLVLFGCTNKEDKYNSQQEKGRIVEINYNELYSKLKSETEILIQISLKGCISCDLVFETEKEYLENNKIVIYNFTMDKQDISYRNKLDYIYSEFKDFEMYPTLIWIDTNKESHLLTFEDNHYMEDLKNFIEKYKIID